ncbi:hypothetical protein EGR_03074 [Echinococcus granulosus]|uniref:Uncharacterized protein n=1 Tax=Echinococcus granulosus TaxID=6210 RepID=W6ULY1_ECHGR|nr:hypothetical protein EGR_03074 [Echinococcus granulosus]EUB62053.1 hypothetical protein EGR_03074 [Echinococcus granulosus]
MSQYFEIHKGLEKIVGESEKFIGVFYHQSNQQLFV